MFFYVTNIMLIFLSIVFFYILIFLNINFSSLSSCINTYKFNSVQLLIQYLINFVGKGRGSTTDRRHTKGCNCKRSGCLKNYCECYEVYILSFFTLLIFSYIFIFMYHSRNKPKLLMFANLFQININIKERINRY